MITIYKIIDEIKEDREYMQKILIGGLLMFVPIVNFFALGYLYRFAGRIMSTGRVELPAWDDWGKLFLDGLILLGVAFLYGFFPIFIGWSVSQALDIITLRLLYWLPYFPLSIALLVAPSLTLLGIFSLLKGEGFQALFTKIGDHFKNLQSYWKELMIGNLAYLGFCLVGMPLYGFSHFIGFLLLIPYTLFVLKTSDDV